MAQCRIMAEWTISGPPPIAPMKMGFTGRSGDPEEAAANEREDDGAGADGAALQG
jgi:hypothetical protein